MEVKAKAKHIRMSPRKVRLVVNLVRGLEIEQALDQLTFNKKLAVKPLIKLINSALANAEHNFNLGKSNLFIKEIKVDEGPTLHRWQPRAHGRATPIRKKTSHINLVLAEIKASGERQAKKQKLAAPLKMQTKPKQDEGIEMKKKEEQGKSEADKEAVQEKGKKVADPRVEGRHGHAKIEGGGKKGFVGKLFQRKSG